MDEIDRKILRCLRENARMSASAIGQRVNLSVSAVIERIKKMEASGVIRQYTALLDPACVGRDICAYISVSLEHPKHNEAFSQSVRENSHIDECHYVTGDFDFLIKVATDSTRSLESVLAEIKSIKGVSLTRTLVVLSTVKQDVPGVPGASL
ncbi:Lrp/AsnC family transcriptional regulator [Eubacteriales bacterium OttesenSCG-928-A19]|nr:Lrp/AsnC family transcriptional regulator [Eubacteriales bacterium OttesenSCG-928-A19]